MMKTMRTALAGGALICSLMAGAGVARAADVDFTAAPVLTGSCWLAASSGFDRAGQTFVIPAGETNLTSFALAVAQQSGSATPPDNQFTLSLHRVVSGTPGPALATGSFQGTPEPAQSVPVSVVNVMGPLPVVAGDTYYIAATYVGGSDSCVLGRSEVYGAGSVYQRANPSGAYSTRSADTVFRASFGVATVTAVPTMSEWAMILLGLTLAGAASIVVNRRRLSV